MGNKIVANGIMTDALATKFNFVCCFLAKRKHLTFRKCMLAYFDQLYNNEGENTANDDEKKNILSLLLHLNLYIILINNEVLLLEYYVYICLYMSKMCNIERIPQINAYE